MVQTSSNNNGRSNSIDWMRTGLQTATNDFTWTGRTQHTVDVILENIYSLGTTSEYIDITSAITAWAQQLD